MYQNISARAARGDVRIVVENDHLLIKEGKVGEPLPFSTPYAQCLVRAGIQQLDLTKGTSAKNVKRALRALSTRGLGGIIKRSKTDGIQIDEPERPSLSLPISWPALYNEIAAYKKSEAPKRNTFMLVCAILSLEAAAAITRTMHGATKYIKALGIIAIGLLAACTLKKLINAAANLPARIAHAYHAIRFLKDYQQLALLANGIKNIDPHRLDKVLYRVSRDSKTVIIQEYAKHWDFETLDWALEKSGLIEEKEMRTLPQVSPLISFLKGTNHLPTLLEEFSNPLWIIREAVALNPLTPEDILGTYVNTDKRLEVRKAVAENPRIKAMIARIEQSKDPEVLAGYVPKPFPCVRTAAAKSLFTSPQDLRRLAEDEKWGVAFTAAQNPNCPWEAVAFVLGKMRKEEEYEFFTEMAYCGSIHEIAIPKIGFFEESLKKASAIMGPHLADKDKIMGQLKKLNPDLYKALIVKFII